MTKFKIIIICFVFVAIWQSSQVYAQMPFPEGETIKYNIIKTALKAGEAELVFKGEEIIEGKNAYLIVFTAKGFNFYDEERIYLDSETFLPLLVKRDVNIFGKKEKIVERYSQAQGLLEIETTAGETTKKTNLKKETGMENIYGFIYRYRLKGEFKAGKKIDVVLPTKHFVVQLKDKRNINSAGKKYNAFFMQGTPSNLRLWFDDSDKKIPLRIDGTFGIGSTSLIMVDYIEGKNKEK